jgi:hypothetical protein
MTMAKARKRTKTTKTLSPRSRSAARIKGGSAVAQVTPIAPAQVIPAQVIPLSPTHGAQVIVIQPQRRSF